MDALKTACEQALKDTAEKMALLDWDAEFTKMKENKHYSPVPYSEYLYTCDNDYNEFITSWDEWEDDWEAYKRASESSKKPVIAIVKDIVKLETDALRKALKNTPNPPELECEACGFLACYTSAQTHHECEKTTQCGRCDHKATTYARLEAHIKSKHTKRWSHSCKDCEFHTDSKSQYDRHMKSKVHKEATGYEAPKHECLACERSFPFASELKRHLFSKEHKKCETA